MSSVPASSNLAKAVWRNTPGVTAHAAHGCARNIVDRMRWHFRTQNRLALRRICRT
jgi:hypothetical protein